MATARVYNPISYGDLVKRFGVEKAASEWKKLKKKGQSRKTETARQKGRAVMKRKSRKTSRNKKRSRRATNPVAQGAKAWATGMRKAGLPTSRGRKGLSGMPKTWRKKWAEGMHKAGKSIIGQPVPMTKAWKRNWSSGALAASKPDPRTSYGKNWRRGVKQYASNPMTLEGVNPVPALTDMVSTEGLKDMAAVISGLTGGALLPERVLRLFKLSPTPITRGAATLGVATLGLVAGNFFDQRRAGRLFALTVIGGYLTAELIKRLPISGVGQLEDEASKAVEAELEKALSEASGMGLVYEEDVVDGLGIIDDVSLEPEGLGLIYAEDMPGMGILEDDVRLERGM